MPSPEETPDVSRSAVTGQFVSEAEAQASPDTTITSSGNPRRGRPTPKPAVGRIVHYVSFGTPGGEYGSMCRAAQITEVDADDNVGLVVQNPTGTFFHPIAHANGPCPHDEDDHRGGTWHWPEQV